LFASSAVIVSSVLSLPELFSAGFDRLKMKLETVSVGVVVPLVLPPELPLLPLLPPELLPEPPGLPPPPPQAARVAASSRPPNNFINLFIACFPSNYRLI
jgi:hypothetical protein